MTYMEARGGEGGGVRSVPVGAIHRRGVPVVPSSLVIGGHLAAKYARHLNVRRDQEHTRYTVLRQILFE